VRDPAFPRVLLVADGRRTGGRDLVEVVEAALAGGIRFVQIREPGTDDAEVLRRLDRLRAVAPPGTLLAVNGRPAVARKRCVGLHLPAAFALPELADLAFWGRSAHDEREILRAKREGADYLVLGTAFPTPSKPGAPTLGTDGVARLAVLAGTIPVFAIGGIDATRAAGLRAAGIHGVAVCSAVLEAADPAVAAADLIEASGRD
jgi:thiamine-phosphate pyrophosphorylase